LFFFKQTKLILSYFSVILVLCHFTRNLKHVYIYLEWIDYNFENNKSIIVIDTDISDITIIPKTINVSISILMEV